MKTRDLFRVMARPFNIGILVCVLIFAVVFAETAISEIIRSFQRPAVSKERQVQKGKQWEIAYSSKEFMSDGTVLLINTVDKKVNVYDRNYKKLWQGKDLNEFPEEYKFLKWLSPLRLDKLNDDVRRYERFMPDMSQAIEIPIRQDKKIREIWRYLPGDHVFEGYEYKGERIGFFGLNGFAKNKAEAGSLGKFSFVKVYFPDEAENPIFLWETVKRFFSIDFENRKTEVLIDGGEKKIGDIRTLNWSYDGKEPVDPNYRIAMSYTEDSNIHLMLKEPKQELIIKTPEQWEKFLFNHIEVTATKDAIFVSHLTSDILNGLDSKLVTEIWSKPMNFSKELYKLDQSGKLEFVSEFKFVRPGEVKSVEEEWIQYFARYTRGVTIFSPLIFYAGKETISNCYTNNMFYDCQVLKSYIQMIEIFYPFYLMPCIILSILMMVIAGWHGWARINSRFSLVLWVLFVGLFNVAGLVTYLAMNHKRLIKCHSCGGKRNLDKAECIRCGAGLKIDNRLLISDETAVNKE